jgi:hypothetical protein
MEKVLESEYFILEQDKAQSIFIVTWKSSSENINPVDLPQHAGKIISTIIQGGFQYFIANDVEFKVPITPEIQDKLNANLVNKLNGVIKKFAHVSSSEMISQLSLEQLFDENKKHSYEDRFFSTLEEALSWVKEK